MKALFLTEAGSNYGFGHIARCCGMYEAFTERGVSSEMIINSDGPLGGILGHVDHRILDWLKNKNDLYNAVKGKDIVVIDSYMADIGVYRDISKKVKVTVYLDDNGRLDYPEGIVVNGSIYGEHMDYPAGKDITYLVGVKFMSLRKEFRKVPDKKIKEEVDTVMVTFGGDDPGNTTPVVLKLLKDKYPLLVKKVVVGRGFRHADEIEKNRDDHTRIIYSPGAREMKNIMMDSDIAVSAGGQTLYELARTGVPTVAVAVAENQLNNVKYWEKTGFAGCSALTNDRGGLYDELPVLIDRLMPYKERARISLSVKRYVDGNGADNIVNAVLEKAVGPVCKKKEARITLREADTTDCRDIWMWRENIAVRKWSFNKDNIDYNDHRKWFETKLMDKNTMIWIAENEGAEKLGQIRFEKGKNGMAYVSVNLNPEYIGKGLGQRIIKEGTRVFTEKEPGIKEITAKIITGNIASEKAFLKAGYVLSSGDTEKDKGILFYRFDTGTGK